MLVALSGRPGVGKTTIARELARVSGAVHLRIDTIEQALRNAGWQVVDEGYRVARAVAEDNLRVGRFVVSDCVNPWSLTRAEWRAVARRAAVGVVEVEVVCSDAWEHRRRVEARRADIDGHHVPTWEEVLEQDYHEWETERLVIDSSRCDLAQCVAAIAAAARRA